MKRYARLLGLLTIAVVLPVSAPARAECYYLPSSQVCARVDGSRVSADTRFATILPHLGSAYGDMALAVDPVRSDVVVQDGCGRFYWQVGLTYCTDNVVSTWQSGGYNDVSIWTFGRCLHVVVQYVSLSPVVLYCPRA